MFFVYVDHTLEGRPFYVGKGNAGRLRQRERNVVHTRISKKHGMRREVVFACSIERVTLDFEIELIAELKTQCGIPGHWGANLTAGGEGLLNPSPETRRRLSEAQRKRAPDGEITRRKKSLSARRLNTDPDVRRRKSDFMKSHVRTPEHCATISRAKQKSVEQLDVNDNIIACFPSAKRAEEITGVSRSKICMCCKGTRPRAGGYHWRYGTSDSDR